MTRRNRSANERSKRPNDAEPEARSGLDARLAAAWRWIERPRLAFGTVAAAGVLAVVAGVMSATVVGAFVAIAGGGVFTLGGVFFILAEAARAAAAESESRTMRLRA